MTLLRCPRRRPQRFVDVDRLPGATHTVDTHTVDTYTYSIYFEFKKKGLNGGKILYKYKYK